MLLVAGKESRVRPTEAERDAETLCIAESNVGTKLARRFQQGEGKQVGSHREGGASGMDGI